MMWHLYGGTGIDTFKISSFKPALIRDYQLNEIIILSETLSLEGESIAQLQFSTTKEDLYAYTEIRLDDRTLFSLDGSWAKGDVSISMFS